MYKKTEGDPSIELQIQSIILGNFGLGIGSVM